MILPLTYAHFRTCHAYVTPHSHLALRRLLHICALTLSLHRHLLYTSSVPLLRRRYCHLA